MGILAPIDLSEKACAAAVARIASEAARSLGTRSFRCTIHTLHTRPPTIRFPGRLPHPRKGPSLRIVTDQAYDATVAPDGTMEWTLVGPLSTGAARPGQSKAGGADAPDALLVALGRTGSPVWDALCRELSISTGGKSFHAVLKRQGGVALLKGSSAWREGSHRVGRYADLASVRGDWSACWARSRNAVHLDLRSNVAHGTPQAAELEPRAFSPLYTERIEVRILVTRSPKRA